MSRVFDSNILIYYLNRTLPHAARARADRWITEGAAISVITRIEVLGYPQTADELRRAAEGLERYAEALQAHPRLLKVMGHSEAANAGNVGAFFDQSPMIGIAQKHSVVVVQRHLIA